MSLAVSCLASCTDDATTTGYGQKREHIYVTGMEKGLGKRQKGSEFCSIWSSGMDDSGYPDKPWQFQCTCTVVFPLED